MHQPYQAVSDEITAFEVDLDRSEVASFRHAKLEANMYRKIRVPLFTTQLSNCPTAHLVDLQRYIKGTLQNGKLLFSHLSLSNPILQITKN